MPVEFTTFLTKQIKDFLEGVRDEANYTKQRLVNPKEEIDENKFMYCREIGYSNQAKVSEFCGSKEYCKLRKWNEKQQQIEFEKVNNEE